MSPLRVCIVSDGAFGERAFEQCMARFPTDFALVEPLPPTVVDDVTIEVPEADLYLSYLRSPAQALALVEKGRPVVLGVSFGPGFVRQAREINPAVVAPETMCSLEPTTGNEALDTFALAFGRPQFEATVREGNSCGSRCCAGRPAAPLSQLGRARWPGPSRQRPSGHFGLRICHHCRAPRLGRTCDKETAGLIDVRELLRVLPPSVVDAETAAFGAECDRLCDRRTGRPDAGITQPDLPTDSAGDTPWLNPRNASRS